MALAVLTLIAPLISAVIASVALGMVRNSPKGQRFLVRRPVRQAIRRSPHRKDAPLAVDRFVDLLAVPADPDQVSLEPVMGAAGKAGFERDVALASDVAARLETRRSGSLVGRILLPEMMDALQRRSSDLRTGLERLSSTRLVRRTEDDADWRSFRRSVEHLTGTQVLADAVGARGRVATSFQVWHHRRYRGTAGGGTYEEHHGANGCEAAWAGRRVGDYDARILDVEAVSLGQDPSSGRLSFVLETAESCYATTEDGDGPLGCKHLDPTTSVGGRFYETPDRWTAVARGDRVAMLASYVVVLSSDGHVVLCHRSRRTRTGHDLISATAGGVCEAGTGGRGDVDRWGAPDPLETVRRETREEVGLDLPMAAVVPVCTFLANSVEPQGDDLRGQCVVTALSLHRSAMSFDELEQRARTEADVALGAFEVHRLVPVPATSATDMAAWASDRADRLDQHGVLSLIYTSAVLFGPISTRRAMEAAFGDRPWWAAWAPDVPDRRLPMVGGQPAS